MIYHPKIIKYEVIFAVLDGELAEPCNLQSATAGLNSRLRLTIVEFASVIQR